MAPAYVLRPFPQLTSRYDFVLAPPVPFPMLSTRTQFNPGDFSLKRAMRDDANETCRPSKKPRQFRRSPTPEVMAKHVHEYNAQLSEEEEEDDEDESEDDEQQEREEIGPGRGHPMLQAPAQAGPSQLIPKPKGEPGRPSSGGFKLRKALEDLGWKKESIDKLTTLTKQGMEVTLDAKQSYRQQDKELINRVCDVVQQAIPVLTRYEGCWPYGVLYEKADAVAGPQAHCWIGSEANKPFSINIRKEEDDSDYRAAIYMDHQLVTSKVFHKTITGTQTISSVYISDHETRNFVFAPLELTDDDSYLENPPVKNIGKIFVAMTRGKCGDYIPSSRWCDVEDVGKVHERLKIGLSHRIKYGPPEQAAVKRTCIQYDVLSKPATFNFNYRPLGMLQASGMAPRIQSQSEDLKEINAIATTKIEEIINVDSDDEKERELLAQLEYVRNRKRAKQNNGLLKKKVKAEPIRHFVPEVIDLTV
ncbi:hypothetical protein HYPSUDRAFT_202591 [Hypholoma sublateritium FD-334 SS-4]|uniref:DUF7918 domain-containing protein n=1 Tax=Hypholoma sublateritium (strain FD-334 SS-4) TaxID=945553 RepID=A0A0D2NZI6_HYPSF|nr:hypothetical protein HYPSUDRAFT_202591 [Hypholoma sublateritium FD-334 SS-4]